MYECGSGIGATSLTSAMKPDEHGLLRLRLRCLGPDIEFQAVFVLRIAGVRGEETL